MLDAIAGDAICSFCEVRPVKTTSFDLVPPRTRFTDDIPLTVAAA